MCPPRGRLADQVLKRHAVSLKSMFDVYSCSPDESKKLSRVMGVYEWNLLLKDVGVVDMTFSVRDAAAAFVQARMRVVDERASKLRVENLSLEDFFEALLRVATMKPLPNEQDVKEQGCEDAGQLVVRLRAQGATILDEFLAARAGVPPTDRQPPHRALDALCTVMVRVIEAATAGKDNMEVTPREAAAFKAMGGIA